MHPRPNDTRPGAPPIALGALDGRAVPGRLSPATGSGRIVIVSNRLPFALEDESGDPRFSPTVGGLTTGLQSFLERGAAGVEHVWVGWLGAEVSHLRRERIRAEAMDRFRAVPVFLRDAEVQRFYEGFSNRTIWPLFHCFPSFAVLDESDWNSYAAVNARFRDAVLDVLRPGDVVWVHDYQLMLLPALLRERVPDLPISFFLHVPFPPHEIYRILPEPWARALLEGMLGADLVGVHTYDYARHVLRAAQRVLGIEHRQGELRLPGRLVRVEAFPIGIDFERFESAASDPRVQAESERLRAGIGERRAVLSIDRLDYTKGILSRILAFERFLDGHPEWHDRVSLVAVVVPSRTRIDSYQKMQVQIEESVGRVNGRFGHVGWTPVFYQFRALGFATLAALYGLCDVALVTPLRDGMNLIAKEYLAARADETGVLVLSDMAGAARELGEALIVNPHHVAGVADRIREALELPVEEQRRRNRTLRARLRRYDVVRWGTEQLSLLQKVRDATSRYRASLFTAEARGAEVARWRGAGKRLLLLDYDGTLVPFTRDPGTAVPDARVRTTLARLAADPANTVVVVSGRDAQTLDAWLGDVGVGLVAEHGASLRDRDGPWSEAWTGSTVWKPDIVETMQVFADRLPGSIVEEKDVSVAWHYRGADEELGPARARELVDALRELKSSAAIQVLLGNRVVEVRPRDATKGHAAARWIARAGADFVLAAGDDATDEDLFAALPPAALSIRVGLGDSHARFNVEDSAHLLGFLEELAERCSA
jgi:trehalose 6-phosphate synthase/phosphatase